MRDLEKCACGAWKFLQEQLKQYKKKEITMSKDELRELEKWVASGHFSKCGDYIYSENGC